MSKRLKGALILTTILATIPAHYAAAQEIQNSQTGTTQIEEEKNHAQTVMERVMVIGSKDRVQDIVGSAHFIDKETLDQNNYTDIHRVLRQVPGVNIQEEEGYGNRPNIGLRGSRSDRSADITLMEDGVLIAPAPYASPSAYYFPRINRIEAVEVRKGSSTIKFGPRTTSGAINLISSSIPDSEEIEALAAYGSYNTQRLQAHYGNSYGQYGFVVDASHESTDGFKDIDIVGGDTGYSIQDIMGKFRVTTPTGADIFQSFEIKLGATEEESDETYLGLTQEDFDADPLRRYAATQLDNLEASHRQYQLRHFADFGDFDATTTVYHNQFSRNWDRLRDITIGGVNNGLTGSLNDPIFVSALQGLTDLDGSAANHLDFRANAREYYSTGIQTDLATEFKLGETNHDVEFGIRHHYDKEDRFQQEDRYAITGGVLNLVSEGAPGSQSNRHATAQATAIYLLDEIKTGPWTFVPGVRYEYIDLKREDFNSGDESENSLDVLVPGLGVGYQVNNELSVFSGVHKGFAPPSPGSTTGNDNEESINYEIGARYITPMLNVEMTGFFNDYSNLLGECTLSSGCTGGTVGDQFNAGEVDVYGAEFGVNYDAASALGFSEVSIPINFNYTYTQTKFKSSFSSAFDEFGNVSVGDELPYIPEHQFFISAGVVAPKWEFHASGKYVDETRTQAGSGSIPSGQGTDEAFIVDIAGEYEVHDYTRAFFTVDNLFDTQYLASRRPAGARPGRPMTLIAGVKFEF